MKKLLVKYIVPFGGLLISIFLSSFLQESELIKYTQKQTIHFDNNELTHVLTYNDSTNNNPLYLLKSQQDIPLNYFKNIKTEVCYDKECQPLIIRVYWNITGRYLGFELPKGEFLSKRDHEPFENAEYEKLNRLLADATLPFGRISFEKLIEVPDSNTDEVDAISGATSENIAKIVVKGAAYTTHKLWNIIYGPTMDFVSQITENQLTPDLTNMILNSPDISDRIWALDRLDPNSALNTDLMVSLLNFISGEDFYMAYNALEAIEPIHLNSTDFQLALFSIYAHSDPNIKIGIVKKLMEAPYLSSEIVRDSNRLLEHLNGRQLGEFLKLYSKFEIDDVETCRRISRILQNENRYISQKAYQFLSGINTKDALTLERVKHYKEIKRHH